MLSPIGFTNPQPIFFDQALLAALGLSVEANPGHTITGLPSPLFTFAADDADDEADKDDEDGDDEDGDDEDDLDEDDLDEEDDGDDDIEDDAEDDEDAENAPQTV